MALTFPAAYAAKSKLQNVEEDWLVQLYYGAEGANDWIGISGSDRVVTSIQYYGIIEDYGEIEQSINLVESKASTASLEINVINKFKNGTLSAEMYGGTNKYLNRKVKVYSCLNDETTLANCALLFQGQLININHNQELVTLGIEQKSAWDYISIPQDKTGTKGMFAPVAYGNNANNTPGSECNGRRMYPCPVHGFGKGAFYAIGAKSEASGVIGHYYDKNINKYLPIDNGSSTTFSLDGVYQFNVPLAMARQFEFSPTLTDIDDEVDDTENAYDGSLATMTGAALVDSQTKLFKVNSPVPDLGYASALLVKVDAEVEIESVTGATPEVAIIDNIYSATSSIVSRAAGDGAGTTRESAYSRDIQSAYVTANHQLPDTIQLSCTSGIGGADEIEADARIREIFYDATYEMDLSNINYDKAVEEATDKVKMLFLGSDGFDKDYNGGSGTAVEIHEIHRDMLDRFADIDYADINMVNWGALDTARSGWQCHWWILEPEYLSDILDRIQFEGCFIFLLTHYDGDGNPGASGKYIWVKDTYSSGDVTQTLSEIDYENIEISMTDIKGLVTKTIYHYDREAATENYIEEVTYTNSTARTNWNVSTLENSEQKNLDFITANKVYDGGISHSNPNDCVALYYDNIKANPKIIIQCEMINIAKSDIELGDIIQFNDSGIGPYGKTWGDLYFMVTELRRTQGKIQITSREVYEA